MTATTRALVLLEVALEPRHRLGVEVVGRLVEQQQVGRLQQQPAERDAAALAAGELGHVGVGGRQPQRVHRLVEVRVEVPGVGRVDAVLQARELVGGLVGVVGGELVEAVEHVAQLAHAVLDVALHVLARDRAAAPARAGRRSRRARAAASPRYSVSWPAMIRSSVDLPAPFRPSTPIFAPGRKLSEMSRSTCLSGGCVRDSLYIEKMYWLDIRRVRIDAPRGRAAEGPIWPNGHSDVRKLVDNWSYMRPLIGVTTSELRPSGLATLRRQGEPDHPEMALGMTYVQRIERAGAVPVVLPPCVSDLESLIARLDGVCLSGGPDLDPGAYGAADRHEELGPTEPSLDAFELALARAALERGMPLLGICRGAPGAQRRLRRDAAPARRRATARASPAARSRTRSRSSPGHASPR